uniref:Ragulator complex protein LAMTOR1 n=1 Tax=Heterorhabditis bacteriophora TaxID=37862 RepID=A0A1I7XKZ1_HETBA
MDIIKKICCCNGEDDDQSAPYERLNDEDSVTIVRSREEGHLNGGVDDTDYVSTTTEAVKKELKTKEQEEQEALNRILENTQHNIIDVSHMEGMALNTSDYIERARQYEEAVRSHDLSASRGVNSTLHNSGKHGKRLLEDSGNRVADWLGRPSLTAETIEEIRQHTASISKQRKNMQKYIQHYLKHLLSNHKLCRGLHSVYLIITGFVDIHYYLFPRTGVINSKFKKSFEYHFALTGWYYIKNNCQVTRYFQQIILICDINNECSSQLVD